MIDQQLQSDSSSSQYREIEQLVTDHEPDSIARNSYGFSASDFNPGDVRELDLALDRNFSSDEDSHDSENQISCKNDNEIDHDEDFNETAVVTSGTLSMLSININ